jgi:nicotinate-nucleotide--dimethylbenzimidazole phosphoribosyltransferase
MSSPGPRAVLVLGGIRSGRSRYAESLVAGAATVRRVAPDGQDDLAALCRTLTGAAPEETLLVDGLDRWLGSADRDALAGPSTAAPTEPSAGPAAALAAAVRDSAARLVLVSAETGLAVPDAAAGRSAEAVGVLNQAVAEVVDEVVLVVAGQPIRLRGAGDARPAARLVTGPDAIASPALDESRLSALSAPDEHLREAVSTRLAGTGMGALAAAVSFAAATQGSRIPAPWRTVRVLVLHGDHGGAASAGAGGVDERVASLHDGSAALAGLAAQAGAQVRLVATGAAAAIEEGPAASDDEVAQALATGWQLAEQAADEGTDLLVLASIGDGADTAAAAVTAVLGGAGAEPAGLLARVPAPDGSIDDASWTRRCAALRDAVYRAKSTARTDPRGALAELGGADIATAAGVVLGAAARRTPVALDGPVGAAGALVARHLAPPSRHWCLLTDHGGHPTVTRVGSTLGLTPVLDLALALGEGTTTLAVLPLLRSAITLSATGPPQ